MARFELKYGDGRQRLDYPDGLITGVVLPNPAPACPLSEADIVRRALENPIGTPRLRDMVKPGQTACLLVPDITRAWQKPHLYVPLVVEELTKGGVRDEDMLIVCATGSHRGQSAEEHRAIVSPAIYSRIRVLDHDCHDTRALRYAGTTSRGTPVHLNRHALDCDHLVLTGGILYHFLAGFGGGKKYVFPGVCGYGTIMRNHAMSFNPGMGSGRNRDTRNGNMTESNPIHMDMLEGARMANPAFMMNVVMGGDGAIQNAVAGHFEQAHAAGVDMVRALDEVAVGQKSPLVIASACGFPKDINLYQTAKTLYNAMEAAAPGGTIIVLAQCREGLGSRDMEAILALPDMPSREADIRREYTIGKGMCYDICQCAKDFSLILVSDIDPALLQNTPIRVVKTVGEAVSLAGAAPACIMPHGASTMPVVSRFKQQSNPGGEPVDP